MSIRLLGPFTRLCAFACACSTTGTSLGQSSPDVAAAEPESGTESPMDATTEMDAGDVAPAQLVADGQYFDVRFLDMMAAHHAMAIAMA
jgi:uncharacterized protein (DUF305 family)